MGSDIYQALANAQAENRLKHFKELNTDEARMDSLKSDAEKLGADIKGLKSKADVRDAIVAKLEEDIASGNVKPTEAAAPAPQPEKGNGADSPKPEESQSAKANGPKVDPDTGLPTVDPDALRENDAWVKEAGDKLFKNEDFLRVTEAHEQDYLESRARARKNIKNLRSEAKRRDVDWRRLQDNALIPQINAIPKPDTKNVHRARREMAEVLRILTERPNHRRTPDGEPEIPLYRYAEREDMADIRSFQQSRNKKTHKMVGSWNVGGRWIVPNRDPVTKTRTAFQRAVGYAMGEKLKEFVRADRELARAEVGQARAESARAELSDLLDEMPGTYTCQNKSGTGSVVISGAYRTVRSDEGEEEVFHITLESAHGVLEHLSERKGFQTRLEMVRPLKDRNGPAISRKVREAGGEKLRDVQSIVNTVHNALKAAQREQKKQEAATDEQIKEAMSESTA